MMSDSFWMCLIGWSMRQHSACCGTNLDVVKRADHVIDLGPEGGAGGGRIVVEGTPEKVARTRASETGKRSNQSWSKPKNSLRKTRT